MKVDKITVYLLYIVATAFSALTTLLLVIDKNVRSGFHSLWVLPVSFFLVSIFTPKIISNFINNLTVSIIWGGYFIRFVLTPLALMLGDYQVVFRTLLAKNVEKAILLMTYEVFIVFAFLEIYLRVKYSKSEYKPDSDHNNFLNLKDRKIFKTGIIFLSLLCICIILYIPELKYSFTSIFSSKVSIVTVDYNIDTVAVRGTFKRALSSLFVFIFDIIRYIIPVYLIKTVYKKYKDSRFGYTLSLIICVSPFLVISGSNVQPFIGLIINLVMMSKLYSPKRLRLNKIIIIVGTVLLVSIFLSKMMIIGGSVGASALGSLAVAINAYFPGVVNVAAAFNIIDDNKLKTLFYDFFSTIPFRYSIFPSVAANEVTLTKLFNSYNLTAGHILPCISGAKHYLGFILAPVIPAFLACFSVTMKNKADRSSNYWEYFFYMFFSIRVAMIPNLYNHITFINIIINQFIPLYFITVYYNRNKVYKRNQSVNMNNELT